MLRIALDTNIILSGLFFEGNEFRLLEKGMEGRYRMVLSSDIIAEVRKISPDKFKGKEMKGIVKSFVDDLNNYAEYYDDFEYEELMDYSLDLIRDKNDSTHVAFVLKSEPDIFVSGDKDFLEQKGIGNTIVMTTAKALRIVNKKEKL